MQKFIATSYWRGVLNVGDLRSFDDEFTAWNYVANELLKDEEIRASAIRHRIRVYEIFEDKPPRLCKPSEAIFSK